ncbi:NUDIX domain-containing protein [Photorhabdus sp. P32]|uniref:NUDIX hydrolase n=1 Tax=Photorhabdus sp. P32 TaxID=3117549 RepID=UPI00311B3F09
MKIRYAARLLIVDSANRVLLFRFVHHNDALAGKSYWATLGGEVESGESFEQAAIRELHEETGILLGDIGNIVEERTFEMMLPDGENVQAEERFFIVKLDDVDINTEGWSNQERAVICHHHWWEIDELMVTTETVYPSDIPVILSRLF